MFLELLVFCKFDIELWNKNGEVFVFWVAEIKMERGRKSILVCLGRFKV